MGLEPHDTWTPGCPRSRRGRLIVRLVAGLLAIGGGPIPRVAQAERVVFQDRRGDATARRTDSGADGPLGSPQHQLPDLLSWSVGRWRPNDPQADLFSGTWANSGNFLCFELVYDGVVNPPGPLGCCGEFSFEPFRYGPNPVYGYVEFDVDCDADTGGELDWPALRPLGNASRFGGLVQQTAIAGRAALDGRALDHDFGSQPFVERSGEDFHFELVGWEIDSSWIQRSEASDWLFGSGETWTIQAHVLHRAHGYSQFCSACCRPGAAMGSYEPLVTMRFSHAPLPDRTTISLVYPLTNAGAAAMVGSPTVEPENPVYSDQNSISEALGELAVVAYAAGPGDRARPQFALIASWEHKDPDQFLDPAQWRVRVLTGGSYTSAQDGLFVWSDLSPDVIGGDFNGDGLVTPADLALYNAYLQVNDGDPTIDADGAVNASIEIADFGPSFSLFDVNYDGLIDGQDLGLIGGPAVPRADYDRDADVDQADFAHLQACLTSGSGGQKALVAGCRNADLDHDWDVDEQDLNLFIGCASGPAVPADPMCGR